MFKKYYRKNVKVILKNGKEFSGYFSDACSEQDNEGPATVVIGRWEIEEKEIEKMELLDENKEDTQK